jgi:hypothetical protein
MDGLYGWSVEHRERVESLGCDPCHGMCTCICISMCMCMSATNKNIYMYSIYTKYTHAQVGYRTQAMKKYKVTLHVLYNTRTHQYSNIPYASAEQAIRMQAKHERAAKVPYTVVADSDHPVTRIQRGGFFGGLPIPSGCSCQLGTNICCFGLERMRCVFRAAKRKKEKVSRWLDRDSDQ